MKSIKTLICGAALALVAFDSEAQFRGPIANTVDLLNGTPLIVTTGGISNITVYGRATQNGYSVSPFLALTNSGTPAIAIYSTPVVPNGGAGVALGTPFLIGTLAGAGTTGVRGNLMVLTNQNNVGIQISVSNTHTASIVVSNLYFITQ